MAEMHKAISRGLVLQEGTEELEEEAVMDTDYADDMAVLDGTKDGLQETTDLQSHYAAYSGLKINSGKTKTMASGAFNSSSRVWYNHNILTQTKIRIYRAAVLTVLLYGSETWSTIKSHVNRIEAFHQRCLRRIMRIKWFSKTSNEIVLQRAVIENVATFISRNRLRWFGHVARMPSERLPKKLLQWKPTHEKNPETDLASRGLTVSRKTITLLPDVTPMSMK